LLGVWFTTTFTRSVPILTRLYTGHLTLLPALFAILIIAHVYLIKQHGISKKPGEGAISGPPTKDDGNSRFTTHLRKMTGYGLLLLALASTLSLVIPAPLGLAGVSGVEVSKPPWMFLPFYPLEDFLGIRGLLVGGGVLFGMLALAPILDRSPYLSPKRRRWIIIAGVLLLVVLIALGVIAWVSQPVPHLLE